MKKITFLLVFAFFFTQCAKDEFEIIQKSYEDKDYAVLSQHLNLPANTLDYDLHFPTYYRGGSSTEINANRATLGRVLFYDKNLSVDGSTSCASCHIQTAGFSDTKAFSDGVNSRATARNSMALGAVFSFHEYYGPSRVPFLWDNKATTAEEQALLALTNKDEMGMELGEMVQRVRNKEYYEVLYEYAYGNGEITSDNLLNAIATFVNSIGSFESKFDESLDKSIEKFQNEYVAIYEDFDDYTVAENMGKKLYVENCGACHGVIAGAPDRLSANNGLDMVYTDKGIGAISQDPEEYALFKVPTLRNITLTAPYMHDGRFSTIEEVLDHYSSGIQDHPNLSTHLKTGNTPVQFDFTTEEKQALIAFFHTLTDEKLATYEKFSDPFK